MRNAEYGALVSGMYFVQVTEAGENIFSSKIIIQ